MRAWKAWAKVEVAVTAPSDRNRLDRRGVLHPVVQFVDHRLLTAGGQDVLGHVVTCTMPTTWPASSRMG
ncbi:hypothetical protein [Brevundimonas aurantiaca]|uniref:hypothetical protein n=1 Tax=Brevundimonas aurantiaca TaxID=74316 RepID=UPI001CD3F1FE|nr:hypothetical protein [Brevundimonas aurantiaca]